MRTTILLAGLALVLVACGAPPSDSIQDAAARDVADGAARVCTPGTSQACSCSSGAMGMQQCYADGTGFFACTCAAQDAGTDAQVDAGGGDAGADAQDVVVDASTCGNGHCDTDERCDTCPGDCGACHAPYNACTTDAQCATNSACVPIALSDGMPTVCTPACSSAMDCPMPSGLGVVSPICSVMAGHPGQCMLAGCSGVPGFHCPAPLTCHLWGDSGSGVCGP